MFTVKVYFFSVRKTPFSPVFSFLRTFTSQPISQPKPVQYVLGKVRKVISSGECCWLTSEQCVCVSAVSSVQIYFSSVEGAGVCCCRCWSSSGLYRCFLFECKMYSSIRLYDFQSRRELAEGIAPPPPPARRLASAAAVVQQLLHGHLRLSSPKSSCSLSVCLSQLLWLLWLLLFFFLLFLFSSLFCCTLLLLLLLFLENTHSNHSDVFSYHFSCSPPLFFAKLLPRIWLLLLLQQLVNT